MRIAACIVALAFLTRLATAQTTAAHYFPLHVGDVWVYGPSDPPETISVRESLILNRKEYFVYESSFWGPDTLRVDTSGRYVYRHKGDRDRLLYDFAATDPFSIEQLFPRDAWHERHGYTWTVTPSRHLLVETPLGYFEDCIGFSFDIREVLDENFWMAFAPSVGVVQKANVWGFRSILSFTNVGGTRVGVEDQDVSSDQTQLTVYPNPTTGWLHADLNISDPGATVLSVYDLLGRVVLTWPSFTGATGDRTLSLDVSGLSPGIYLLRLDNRGFSHTKRFVVVP